MAQATGRAGRRITAYDAKYLDTQANPGESRLKSALSGGFGRFGSGDRTALHAGLLVSEPGGGVRFRQVAWVRSSSLAVVEFSYQPIKKQ